MCSPRLGVFLSVSIVALLGAAAAAGVPRRGNGEVVYDSNQNLYWLANANLAGDANVRAQLGVSGVEPNGMMDYPTALKWVAALNDFNRGSGWLGHHDWQLPTTPVLDPTCGARGPQGASFGGLCQNNALGNLYYVGLKHRLSDNVASDFGVKTGPFENLQLSYYWTGAKGGIGGVKVFSFAAGDGDATTTNDSFYYVLPMVKGEIGEHASCAQGGLVPYTGGPAANRAVFDCEASTTWPINANLAATLPFGVQGEVTILERRPYPNRTGNGVRVNAPAINGGAMLFTTAAEWIAALNAVDNGKDLPRGYLQSQQWRLPDATTINDLRVLHAHLHLGPQDIGQLQASGSVGEFRNLQPFFYWEQCVPNPTDYGLEPLAARECAAGNAPSGRAGGQMNYAFTFGYGIQATDAARLKYFVMVCYPGAKAEPDRRSPGPRVQPTGPVATARPR